MRTRCVAESFPTLKPSGVTAIRHLFRNDCARKKPVRAALAVWIGKTRLIDNVLCEPPLLIETRKKSDLFHFAALANPTPQPPHITALM